MIKADFKNAKINENPDAKILETKLDTISHILALDMIIIKSDSLTKKIITDIDGKFSTELKPGNYYLITYSKKQYDYNYADCNGLMRLDLIELKRNEESQIKIEIN